MKVVWAKYDIYSQSQGFKINRENNFRMIRELRKNSPIKCKSNLNSSIDCDQCQSKECEIFFNNYTGIFEYLDDNNTPQKVLVLHKKICESLQLCDDPSSNKCANCQGNNVNLGKYNQFFHNFLLEIICKLSKHLPFDLISPVSAYVYDEMTYSDNRFLKLLLLIQKNDEIKSSLNHILSNPHRKIIEVEELKRFDEVTYVDSEVIIDILTNPHRWIKHSGGCITYNNDKYSPELVLQYTTEESFDTIENRYVKTFLYNLTKVIDECLDILSSLISNLGLHNCLQDIKSNVNDNDIKNQITNIINVINSLSSMLEFDDNIISELKNLKNNIEQHIANIKQHVATKGYKDTEKHLGTLNSIISKLKLYKNVIFVLNDLKYNIEQSLRHRIFEEVGELTQLPLNSQVLIKQTGYREIFNLDRLLRVTLIPTFLEGMEEAFALKRMDTLWELYVMVNIIKAIEELGYKVKEQKWDEGKLEKDTIYDYASFTFDKNEKTVKISYQESVKVGKSGQHSLRPDFLLECGERRITIDAKFMHKENVKTIDLIRYLTSLRPIEESSDGIRKEKYLSDAVFAACIGKLEDKYEAYSFTWLFDKDLIIKYSDLKDLIDKFLQLDSKQSDGNHDADSEKKEKKNNEYRNIKENQYIGYISIEINLEGR